MTYIAREDGQQFVIPSYRDVLSAKKSGLFQKEVRLVANNYGEYIALQRKSPTQYEVAFSPDPGYLLGETVWSYFKRPRDLIYCEEIANSNEAILVIVKSGSVYLDGKFPIDSIADELLVFQTQTNQFDIYIYGNVPISQTPEEGKISFEDSSVKSFNVLDQALFPKLPIVSQFELKLVDDALKAQGIGGFPVKTLVFIVGLLALIWGTWNYLSSNQEILPIPIVTPSDPYQAYIDAMTSPDPYLEMRNIHRDLIRSFSMPGWTPISLSYKGDKAVEVAVISNGMRTNTLYAWAKQNNATVSARTEGFFVTFKPSILLNRPKPDKIYSTTSVIANLTDRLSYVLPGNNLTIGTSVNKGKYVRTTILINFSKIVPTTLNLIGQQLRNLPLVLNSLTINMSDEGLSGSISLTVLGN